MRRRTVLRRTGALAALGLAGCLGDDERTGTPDDASPDPGNGTDAPTDTPVPDITVAKATLSVTGSGPADGNPTGADVAFDSDANRVVVRGAIEGSEGCKTAALGDVSYDPAADSLVVDVVTQNREGTEDQACTQALVFIDYEVVVEFAGGLPHEASVSHDGDGIASGAWASSSASGSAGRGRAS